MLNVLFDDDVLCFKCRKELNYKPINIKLNSIDIYSLYVYDKAFSKLLLQYKECYDEALFSVFLYPYIYDLRKKYKGYSIILAPSSVNNLERRGFNHLEKIFNELKLPIIDCLYKDSDTNQNNLSFDDRQLIKKSIFLKDLPLPDKVILVDDVLTSGSTISACYNLLKDKIKDLKVFVIAYNKSYLEPLE